MLLERKKKLHKRLRNMGIAAAAVAVVGVIAAIPWFAKIPAYNEAMQLYYDKNYPEATWAFEVLGGYRDSKDMKEKAELSWRKSLATVVSEAYYITSNGNIEGLTDDLSSNDLHNHFQLDKDKKFISITQNFAHGEQVQPYVVYSSIDVLCDDGSIETAFKKSVYEDDCCEILLNSDQNVIKNEDKDWQDIVQTLPLSDGVSVGLKADGRVVYKKTWDEIAYDDGWLKPVLEWKDIISVEYVQGYGNNILVGVTADGTIKITNGKYDQGYSSLPDEINDISSSNYDVLNSLSNVRDIHIMLDKTYTKDFKDRSFSLNIVALTNQGKVISYINGVTNEVEDSKAVDVDIASELIDFLNRKNHIYILKNSSELVNSSTNKVILQDVVYVDDSIVITRNGSVNTYGVTYQSIDAKGIRAVVYDEWVERME